MMRFLSCVILGCLLLSAAARAERLSDWLLQHPAAQDAYPLGLMWEVESEKNTQRELRDSLLQDLSALRDVDRASVERLSNWINTLPLTGRVVVPLADARWMQANPARDPVIAPTDKVILPIRPKSVTVVTAAGQLCQVTHAAGYFARDYIAQCQAGDAVAYAYVAQADGKTARYGIATWNAEKQDEPAPGAWIWVAGAGWPDELSKKIITFLATQGVAQDGLSDHDLVMPSSAAGARAMLSAPRNEISVMRSPVVSANDWGEVGLLQTPTARMRDAGEFAFNLTRSYPYTYTNIAFQPMDWLELAFRYTDISNRLYGPTIAGGQSYKDKSIDAKVRLMNESTYRPALSLGIRDMAGTGLFSGEYIVASKRTGDVDWNLGLGWGYIGARGNVNNPFGYLSSGFNTRPAANVGQGGNFSISDYFRGPAAWFGGVQYQTPWDALVLKLEYDGNNYQHEPLANNFPQATPWNMGILYRVSNSLDFSAGVERGNTAMIGLTMHAALDKLSIPKLDDAPKIAVSAARPDTSPDWTETSRSIKSQTDWQVVSITQHDQQLFITVAGTHVTYWKDYLDRAVAVLQRDAPATFKQFVFIYQEFGVSVAEHIVNREAWVKSRTQLLAPSQQSAEVLALPPQIIDAGQSLYQNSLPAFEYSTGLNLNYNLGGPNGFVLFQVAPAIHAKLRLDDKTWVQGWSQFDVLDNYNKFVFNGSTNLPPVRTNIREYMTASKLTMPNLQMTHMDQLTDNQYFSVYGGYLESMFAGVGAEWLYRPFATNTALGIDINEVRQRDFTQKFSLQNYQVLTGHATLYWDTGWNNVMAKLSAGQYLAGDKGFTVDLSRVFDNGVKMGGYFTKTNVSAQQFGEGSFDKGIYFQIPFDAMLTKSSDITGTMLWQPLIRDGGAKLYREVQLYDLTSARDDRTLRYKVAPPADEFTVPEDLPNGIQSSDTRTSGH